MKVKEGCSYHIKKEFFDKFDDKYLMLNKKDDKYRPHYYAIRDSENSYILWMIPISSKVEKYKKIIDKKINRFNRCNTIIIGRFGGKEAAFLIQNSFPIKEEYLDHIHTIAGKDVTIRKELEQQIKFYLNEIFLLRKKGINLLYANIEKILSML